MSHEGRMKRGKEKIAKGLTDSETEYYLANKDKEVTMPEDNQETPKENKEEEEKSE